MQKVTAALLEKDGRILLAKRKAGKHMGSKWEFPGGKLHPGETPEECLKRELAEELSIDVRIGSYLGRASYCAGDVQLEILLYRAEHVAGTFALNEHEALQWVAPEDLESYDLADSDRRLARLVLKTKG